MRARIILKSKAENPVRCGHPWVFSGAIAAVEGKPAEGELVDVCTAQREMLRSGHFAEGSIAVRILGTKPVVEESEFLGAALRDALSLRQRLNLIDNPKTTAFRLVNAEGDFLPGLVVDVYASTIVLQCHSVGMRRLREQIVKVISELLAPTTIIDRSPRTIGAEGGEVIFGQSANVQICENERIFLVDCLKGQKTGFFLDQRENRQLFGRYAAGRRVLNAFCYTGGFSVAAAKGGASFVQSIDSSAEALQKLKENFELNELCVEHQVLLGDCLQELHHLTTSFELIALDPPAFVKHAGALRGGIKGYSTINKHALRQIAPGGILFTFSCSQFVSMELFRETVLRAANAVGRSVQELHSLGAAPCHPLNPAHSEGKYLKGLVLFVN